jgi:hypothetical protein
MARGNWTELTAWLVMAMTAVMLLRQVQPHGAEMHKVGHSPSAELEVDPTRWRHDGTQAPKWYGYGHGNAPSFVDEPTQYALHNFSAIK